MFASTFGGTLVGIEAQLISIEVNIIMGTDIRMSGLPDSAIKESRNRVESSIKHLGYRMPRKRTVINLAPADLRKEGTAFDLGIALGMLEASDQIPTGSLAKSMVMGELGLDGAVRKIHGVLPMALEARDRGLTRFILPSDNANEAGIVEGIDVIGVDSLGEAVQFLRGSKKILPTRTSAREMFHNNGYIHRWDFSDVKGQESIKRAMEIAAAGSHNILMIGPPGAGKTMLARRLSSILPPLTLEEAMQTTKIYSIAGKMGKRESLVTRRPFRSPHHTISDVALVGGGSNPLPGEISLAHHGVLFLDELPEFKRTVLEVMRQPLEERKVSISRAKVSLDYPANFMLVASMNPCPCGFHNHPDKPCTCHSGAIQRYLGRISGPLLDRIDLHVEVTPVSFDEMTSNGKAENSNTVRNRVTAAREIQSYRYRDSPSVFSNSMINSSGMQKYCKLSDSCNKMLKEAMTRLELSARAYDRILKVSRTIADLDGTEAIMEEHLAEAIQYRSLDRDSWKRL